MATPPAPAPPAPAAAPSEPTKPAEPHASTATKALVVGGSVVLFGGFLLLADASARQGRLDAVCVDSKCPVGKADDIDAYNRSFMIGGIGSLVGAAALGLGIALYYWVDKPNNASPAAALVDMSRLGRRF